MSAVETTIQGWTLRQWAQAAAWFARVYGFTPMPNLPAAGLIYHRWMLHQGIDPGHESLILVDEWKWNELGKPCIELNTKWAAQLFVNVARSVHDSAMGSIHSQSRR